MKPKRILALALLGAALAMITSIQGVERHAWYHHLLAGALAIGLYASTFDIEFATVKGLWGLIIRAVTIGVLEKAAIIGGLMSLIYWDPFYVIVGMSFAQIDPLAVAVLEKASRMSEKAKSILRAVAALDDPMTVLITLYAPFLLYQLTGNRVFEVLLGNTLTPLAYMQGIGINVVFAFTVFQLWRMAKATKWAGIALVPLVIVGATLAVGAYSFWMLGVALVGLDVRPPEVQRWVALAAKWAFAGVFVLLGFLLTPKFNWSAAGAGVVMGLIAYFIAQPAVGFQLTRKLASLDRVYLMFAQQSGITATMLAMLLEMVHPGTIAVVAPAILVVNLCHDLTNRRINYCVDHCKPLIWRWRIA